MTTAFTPARGRRRARGIPAGAAALCAVLLALLTALAGPTGAAYAATRPTSTAPAAAAAQPTASASDPASAAGAASKTGAATHPGTAVGTKPSASPGATSPAKATADAQARNDAAIREIRAADPPQACSGALDPGPVYACAAVPEGGATYSLSVPRPQDLLVYEVIGQYGDAAAALTGPDGQGVNCDSYAGSQQRCRVSDAGTYTLTVTGRYGDSPYFSVSYLTPLSSTSCTTVTAADTALGAPRQFTGSLAAGAVGDCYALPSATGDVLASLTTATATIYDAQATVVCSAYQGSEPCKLTGTAPYRALVWTGSGSDSDYTFTAGRLSDPQGCPAVQVQPYGSVPAKDSASCRAVHIPADGSYLIGASTDHGEFAGSLYTPDGTAAPCPYSDDYMSTACPLTAGDYIWAAAYADIPAGGFALALHGLGQTDGCTAGRDDGFASGQMEATISAAGQGLCWTLPTATRNGLYLATSSDGDFSPVVTVYDAKNVQQCETTYILAVCKLTGTAPFRMLLSGPGTGTARLTVHRTADLSGCAAWPRSSFGGAWGAEAVLTATRQTACLALPASGHSAGEMFDYTNTTNQQNAALHVYDAAGDQVCGDSGSTLVPCTLKIGTSYTAVLVGTGTADSYHLVRRDVSGAAACGALSSTTVGGASIGYTLTSALDSRCLRVNVAAGDKMWFAVRTPGAARDSGAELLVFDGTGAIVCWQQGVSCRATGATSYLVAIVASGYTGTPITAHADTWKVGTASGWAPECTSHPIAPSFAPRSGTLSESAAGSCAVMQVTPSLRFDVYGTQSASYPSTPGLDMFSADRWAGRSIDYQYQCGGVNYGTFAFHCSVGGPAAQVVLIVSAADTAAPAEYSMQGVCTSGCPAQPLPPSLASVSPATGPAGTRTQLVVHGADLTLGTDVELTRDGSAVSDNQMSHAVSASADGSTLTVLLDTTGVAPGTYDVKVGGYGYGTRKFAETLPDAYTVTAAPAAARSKLVPVTPTRFLDTRSGTGAPKARIGAGGVVKLKVAGVHGVPASGVTAVVMNVTAVSPTSSGFVTVYPDGQPLPGVSNINFRAGQTIPNLVTVPVVNGTVDLRNKTGSVDLVADVTGYFTASGGGSSLNPLTPTRFLDTRSGTGAPKARVGAGGVVKLKVAGVHGVPASGVTAVVMNVTAVSPTSSGFVTVYPDGQPLPDASNLNFVAGETIPNLVVVPVVNGTVDLRNRSGVVDLVADVTGYYAASGSAFSTAGPVRLLDTRSGLGARSGTVGPGGVVSLQVAGVEGVPADATAVVLNVTVTEPSTAGFLTVHPHGRALPDASNLNFTAGEVISNLVVVPVVDGRVTFANHSGTVHVVADLGGYFSA